MPHSTPVAASGAQGHVPDMVPWWRTDLGEEEIQAVAESIHGRHINQGPVCRELEKQLAERLDVPHVVLTTSGSAALLLAHLACGVGPGDEVIVPGLTYIATAHAARLLGARVRLADVRLDDGLIDPEQVERLITKKTKAIVAVHLNGQACDLRALRGIAAAHNVRVIEDAAQALCSSGREGRLGTTCDAGTFSMSIAKLITTGEGGFVAVRDEESAARLRKLRNQGVQAVADNVFEEFGFNLRFNDLLAGVGLAQVARLREKIKAVKRVYRYYRNQLATLPYLFVLELDVRKKGGEVPLWTQVLCAQREKVIDLLAERGVQARPFHPCLNASPQLNCPEPLPVAEWYASVLMTLPSGPDQTKENLQRTVTALREIAGQVDRGAIVAEFGPR